MTIFDIRDIGKIAALTLIAWLLPPHLWRKAARATSSIGRDDRSGPAYQRNLAHKYSKSDIATIRYKHRAYLRELKFQILGLIGSWRSWRPDIRLVGTAHLQTALEGGGGAILWVTETVFSTLIAKIALHDAGYHAYQLSRSQHGFSMSPFGVRFLNPIWTGVEDRFIADRVVIKGDTATDALAILRARMAENQVIIITVVAQAHKFVWVPFLRDLLPLPTDRCDLRERREHSCFLCLPWQKITADLKYQSMNLFIRPPIRRTMKVSRKPTQSSWRRSSTIIRTNGVDGSR